MNHKQLTNEERLLLQKYFDGESLSLHETLLVKEKLRQERFRNGVEQDNHFEREAFEDSSSLVKEWVSLDQEACKYIKGLGFLKQSVTAVEEDIWKNSPIVRGSFEWNDKVLSSTLETFPLEKLAPMLERYVDQEVDMIEAKVVEELVANREDVRDYVNSLRWTAQQIQQSLGEFYRIPVNRSHISSEILEEPQLNESNSKVHEKGGGDRQIGTPSSFDSLDSLSEDVDFSSMWGEISSRIAKGTRNDVLTENWKADSIDSQGMNAEARLESASGEAVGSADLITAVLYHDTELDESEAKAFEETLRKKEKPEIKMATKLLQSLHITGLCVEEGIQEALHDVSFEGFYANIASQLNFPSDGTSHLSESTVNVSVNESVPLNSNEVVVANEEPSQQVANDSFYIKYRQGIIGALTALLMAGIALLVYVALNNVNQTVIHKTVVVVEDVKYGPGLTGEVVNPIQQISAKEGGVEDAIKDNEDNPTIIWVYDENETSTQESQKPQEGGPNTLKEPSDLEEREKKTKSRGLSI